jgi:hypothetical protein
LGCAGLYFDNFRSVMRTVRSGFVARQYHPQQPPDVAEYLGLDPMYWSDSFLLKGRKQESFNVYGDDALLRTYRVGVFQTKCKICGEASSAEVIHSHFAVFQHFIHCSIRHDYALPHDFIEIRPESEALQDIITKSQLYDLPMPGFDIHANCLKQELDGKLVCVLHNLKGTWAMRGRLRG